MSDEPNDADEPTPPERLPRRPLRIPVRQLMMIAMLLVALIVVLALRKPCATGVARMIENFDGPDGGPPKALRRPGLPR